MTPEQLAHTLRGVLDALEPLCGRGGYHGDDGGILSLTVDDQHGACLMITDGLDWYLREDEGAYIGTLTGDGSGRSLRERRIHGDEPVTITLEHP